MSPAESTPPPLLEQLGALGSLLIHDMANQMCIISGNATFAQMMISDPKQVTRAVEAIIKAGEHMSFMLGQCAELRRKLGAGLPEGDAEVAAKYLETFFQNKPDWKLQTQGNISGKILIPNSWVLFALEHVFRELETNGGTVRLRQIRPENDTAFLPGGTYFEIKLTWQSSKAFSIDEIRKKYENLELLAAFELLRQSGGRLEGFTPSDGHQELIACIPYIIGSTPKKTT